MDPSKLRRLKMNFFPCTTTAGLICHLFCTEWSQCEVILVLKLLFSYVSDAWMKCQVFQTLFLVANFCPKVDVHCIPAWASLSSNSHFHKSASFNRDGSLPSRKFQAELNSAHSERFHSAEFLANIPLSLNALPWGWELSPLLTLTWIHVSLLHVIYWRAPCPRAFNAQGRQSCSRTRRRAELLWEALPPALNGTEPSSIFLPSTAHSVFLKLTPKASNSAHQCLAVFLTADIPADVLNLCIFFFCSVINW